MWAINQGQSGDEHDERVVCGDQRGRERAMNQGCGGHHGLQGGEERGKERQGGRKRVREPIMATGEDGQ